MPTVVTRYLVTTAGGGGDGSIGTPYNTMEAARVDILADYPSLVSADVQLDLIVSGATDDTTAVGTSWPTSDATRYVHIQAPEADRKAAWDAGVYTLVRSSLGVSTLDLNPHTIRLTGFQIVQSSAIINSGNNGIFRTATAGELWLEGMKFNKTLNTGSAGLNVFGGGGKIIVRNCLFFGDATGWNYGMALQNLLSGTEVILYNNTVVGATSGMVEGIRVTFAAGSGRVVRYKNNLVQRYPTPIVVTGADTDDPVTNHTATTIDATFVNVTTEDFSLDSGDAVAKDLGTDLSIDPYYPFNWDADYDARPFGSDWDIGAHEYGATVAPDPISTNPLTRLTQALLEISNQPVSALDVTQIVAEHTTGMAEAVLFTQIVVETTFSEQLFNTRLRISQAIKEVTNSPEPALWATQLLAEISLQPAAVLRLAQALMEITYQATAAVLRASQCVMEVTYAVTPATLTYKGQLFPKGSTLLKPA